ncbi:Ni/Fe hydrogenase subunit alpha [Roseospirillum parvum]|uniref:Coenzyme F420-reducing hydrogenase, alpha subunit n=1 Tax=Roseospirillum parvum TaxID=83401 RepID=A0A1G7WI45_9PROT|nr:nickel-dependent hydrogenase large subunit [Roseospirillum parvum]SDG71653.1 Coenzyme F420-reducing hydrogenase, alpha subunit [Roseospirillum parvum]
MSRRTIKVEALARVEGEGALDIKLRDGKVKDLKFIIFEPPRFFEAFLQGRPYSDVPDITARICGICPVAYMMGAAQALEAAFGAKVEGPLDDLRRLVYCGEWIESHVLHVAMLHAPDFLGLNDSIELARANPAVVETALRLKKLGNAILETIGGRAVHPVNLKVGGFYRVPTQGEIQALIPELEWAQQAAAGLVRLVAGFDFPDLEQDYTFLALTHPGEYAIHRGTLATNRGHAFPIDAFHERVVEQHVAHSNALHAVFKHDDGREGLFKVGPLARHAINFEQYSKTVRQLAAEAGVGPVVTNPYKSIIVRALENLQALEDALALARAYKEPPRPDVPLTPKAGHGQGCTEAPRGICHHTYETDRDGTITKAVIVPPTAQNQKIIEDDLLKVVENNLHLDDAALTWRCEQTIRNYDPCISCATHFLKLSIDRGA